ncbi:MAG: hypothetical protein HC806_09680 [Anaerolineae bacterium]|nr:hypothetical protein [Anaerolineae bacterium]
MDISKIRTNERQLQALTSLTISEFDELLPVFTHRFEQKYKHFTLHQKRRSKPRSAQAMRSPTRTLPTAADKLLFILYHFKVDTIQFAQAALFDLSQGQTSRWVSYLSPVLHQAIVDLHLQPARTMGELIRLFRNRQRGDTVIDKPGAKTLHVDGTDREITRSVDFEAQRFDYSGKHKMHSAKNSVINDEFRFVHYVGPTHRGAMHDKRMMEEEIPHFLHPVFSQMWLTKDTGYQGYQPKGIHLIEPFKKLKNTVLTKIHKEFNTWVSSIRAVSENTIGGIKVLRRLKHRSRRFKLSVSDLEVSIAAGLHNFRITRRQTTYATGADHVRANL